MKPTSNHTPIILLSLLLQACSHYGFRDRASEIKQPHPLQILPIQVDASRHIDTRLAQKHLAQAMEHCGFVPMSSAQTHTLQCDATTPHSQGLGDHVIANVNLTCTLQNTSHQQRISAQGERLVQNQNSSAMTLVSAQQIADTDALLIAIDNLPCPELPY